MSGSRSPGSFGATSGGLEISVETHWLEEQSDPAQAHYTWAWQIRIVNRGEERVRIVNRYWKITDQQGRVQEVFGAGLVGVRPSLGPGEIFTYASGTSLGTPGGFVQGRLSVEDEAGQRLQLDMPDFSLDLPHSPPVTH